MKKQLFKARERLSSKKHEREFAPGEVIDLSHATEDEINALLERGVIEPIVSERKPTAAQPEGEEE